MAPAARGVTGCVLAGGRGRRLGGADKGLVALAGRPLAAHCLSRLQPQVETMLVSANRNLERYRELGAEAFSDALGDYAGPLAGCLGAMRRARTPWLVTVPCDSPFIPPDLVRRLAEPVTQGSADIAVVVCGGRLQPVFALYDVALADDLAGYLDDGGRKIDTWFDRHRVAEVDFEDAADAFLNVNTAEDLEAAAARLDADA